jgi:hypothetical protein
MALVTIPYGSVGQPAREVSNDLQQVELFTGVTSSFFTDLPYAEDTDLPAWSVVGVDGSGDLVLALNDKTVQVLGVLFAPVLSGTGETGTATIARDGCFNPAALNWDVSYDTDAKKAVAFDGAPSPTQITTQAILG